MDPLRILYLCTGNSARSILSEALTNHYGRGRLIAYSAGSHPTGAVNPMAIQILDANGIDIAGLRSKSWDEFAGADAPVMDLVVTVCSQAAGEICPVWPGAPIATHWGVDDPAAVDTSSQARMAAFLGAYKVIEARVRALTELDVQHLDAASLKRAVDAIAHSEQG